MQDEYIQIGKLGKPHGLNGALKVLLWADFSDFIPKNVLFVELTGDLIPFFITSIKESGAHLLVRFEDFDNPNSAYKLAKKKIFVRKRDLPESYFQEQVSDMDALLGFRIIDQSLGKIGEIIDFDEQVHQTMILVEYNGAEVMIPWVEAYIERFDVDKRIIEMDLPAGLLAPMNGDLEK